jgi:hypothetical protein
LGNEFVVGKFALVLQFHPEVTVRGLERRVATEHRSSSVSEHDNNDEDEND